MYHHQHFFDRFKYDCCKNEMIDDLEIYLHLVRRFWNQVLTWASVILSPRARAARSADAKYFCLWKRFSNSATWNFNRKYYRFIQLIVFLSYMIALQMVFCQNTHLNSSEWCSWFFSLWRSSILIWMSYSSGYWKGCFEWIDCWKF